MKNKKIILISLVGAFSAIMAFYFYNKNKITAKSIVKNNNISDEEKLKTAILNVIKKTDLTAKEKINLVSQFIQGAGLIGVKLNEPSQKEILTEAQKQDLQLTN